jgi:hypothetical protein
VSDLENYGFSGKALKYLTSSLVGKRVTHPLSHYKKDDGKLKKSAKGQTIHSHLENILNGAIFTSTESVALHKLNQIAKKKKEKNQKKQIMDLLKLNRNVDLEDAITYNELSGNSYCNRPYVIKQDWDAGDRHVYKISTLQELIKRSTYTSRQNLEDLVKYYRRLAPYSRPTDIQQMISMLNERPNADYFGVKPKSPFTRREFAPKDILPLSRVLNNNYEGKANLFFNIKKNKRQTIKNVASYY